MSTVVLSADGLYKEFTLNRGPISLKQRFANCFRSNPRARTEQFCAVNNVSLTLNRGEALALNGHNGSGKSTLLQLLSGILSPTKGRVSSLGRVAPLIELGVGFHHELTGLENIFLNSSLFGISNRETKSKINDIIDFSGLDRFIDTPVKNYSSGMYMRLGFSVAVHVNPQVLLADEILAVGDAEFQSKCHQRIKDMQADGMSLILVTHSEAQGREYCTRFLTLERGSVIAQGHYQ